MNLRLEFQIERWCAWVAAELGVSPASGKCGRIICSATPDVSFIPLMQRRRLSPMARAAAAAAWPCLRKEESIPLICCSLHGETYHCFSILNELAAGREVSPSRFALSVHGAVGGLLSQFSGNRAPCVAIAPGEEGYSAALLEAAGMLAEGGGSQEVVIVWYEQPLPGVYHDYVADPAGVMALAVRVAPWRGQEGSLILERTAGFVGRTERDPLLTLIGGFAQSSGGWLLAGGTGCWRWRVESV